MKFKKTIVLILLLSFLVCSAVVVGADAAAEVPYTFTNIHDLLLPAEQFVNNLGQYHCVDWYLNFSTPDRFATSPLLFNAESENLKGFSYNADGRSVSQYGKSWKCITYFDLNWNVLPEFLPGEDYIFDLYFAFYIADLESGKVYEATDLQNFRFLYQNYVFEPVEIFTPYTNVNVAHFNFRISGYDIKQTELSSITLDRGGDSANTFCLNYFEFGIIPQYPCTISKLSEDMKAAEAIMHFDNGKPVPEILTDEQVAILNQDHERAQMLLDTYLVSDDEIDSLNATFDSVINSVDANSTKMLIANWYDRLFVAVPEFYALLMLSLLLGLASYILGRTGKN